MGKINCRGHENRVKLCEQFDIRAAFRIKMIKGLVVSDAGGRITDELYVFSAYEKDSGKFYDKITCGEQVAKDFLLITGEKRPELFNILKSSKIDTVNTRKDAAEKEPKNEKATVRNVQTESIVWHPVNRALYETILIMILVWNDLNIDGNSILFKQLQKCVRYPDKYPFSDRIMSVNTIIGKDKRKTLANILDSLKAAGNELRDFDLELLHEAVLKTGVKSNIL